MNFVTYDRSALRAAASDSRLDLLLCRETEKMCAAPHGLTGWTCFLLVATRAKVWR